jgi:hypothetical protein
VPMKLGPWRVGAHLPKVLRGKCHVVCAPALSLPSAYRTMTVGQSHRQEQVCGTKVSVKRQGACQPQASATQSTLAPPHHVLDSWNDCSNRKCKRELATWYLNRLSFTNKNNASQSVRGLQSYTSQTSAFNRGLSCVS